jgi:hypothetical protein
MERIDRLHHKDKANKSSKIDWRVDEAPCMLRRAALFLWNGLAARINQRGACLPPSTDVALLVRKGSRRRRESLIL